ncbi:hypothetical protein L1887_15350 [Cichorium endivia]|nr:hypothetical protein L1887_15350 [Cichorium endivia]
MNFFCYQSTLISVTVKPTISDTRGRRLSSPTARTWYGVLFVCLQGVCKNALDFGIHDYQGQIITYYHS